jgi:hypothetical protein
MPRNLDYPEFDRAARREGSRGKDDDTRFLENFRSFSSAHAIACAGIIAADLPKSKKVEGHDDEPGCLGIAPYCEIIPYRAMTLTEPVLHKRQMLARAVLEAATGVVFDETMDERRRPHPKVGDLKDGPADVLVFPYPWNPCPVLIMP